MLAQRLNRLLWRRTLVTAYIELYLHAAAVAESAAGGMFVGQVNPLAVARRSGKKTEA